MFKWLNRDAVEMIAVAVMVFVGGAMMFGCCSGVAKALTEKALKALFG
jgi:hypothetical protein